MPEGGVTTDGGPDGSITIESKTNGPLCFGEAGEAAVRRHVGEWQAQVSRPDGTLISSQNAKVMLWCRRKRHSGKRRAPQPVEAGVGSDPYAAFTIDQHLPYRVGAKSLPGGKAHSRGARRRLGCWPLVHMIEPPQAFIAYRPNRTVCGEGKVSELDIFFALSAEDGWDGCAVRVDHAAESMIIREPDGTIRGLMEIGVVGGRGQNESGRGRTGIEFHPFERGLTWGHKEQSSLKRPYPNRSFTVDQNGCGKTTRVSMLRTNLLTHRSAHVEETTRRLQPQRAIPVLGDSFHLQDRCASPVSKGGQVSSLPEQEPCRSCLEPDASRGGEKHCVNFAIVNSPVGGFFDGLEAHSVKAEDPGRGSGAEGFIGRLLDINDS